MGYIHGQVKFTNQGGGKCLVTGYKMMLVNFSLRMAESTVYN